MPEAIKEVMRHAFNDLNVGVIYTGHAAANNNSKRMQDKLGLKIIGELPNYREWSDGTKTSLIKRRMTREEFLKLNKM